MPRLNNKIAIVDIETTGPNIDEGDRIIQIGAIIISEGKIVNTYSMLINPNRKIPDHIAKLTGIEEKDVENAPQFNSVASLWHERLKDCTFVAHNLGFDLRILKESFAKFDLEFDPIALDSVVLAKIILPTALGFNLTDLSRHFNLGYKEAHNALSDALITADIINKLAEIVMTIPQDTLHKMKPFIKHLSHNELTFFEEPQKFLLNETLSDEFILEEKSSIDSEIDSTMTTITEYIAEKWLDQPYMILEDKRQPISYDCVFNEKVLSGEGYLLSLPTLSESNYWLQTLRSSLTTKKIAQLKSQSSYIHVIAFENFISTYNFNRNNQQELLVISATIHWLSQSMQGDFSEINKELSVKPLLNKYQAQDLQLKNHSKFHNAIENAKEADIIITYDLNLQIMMAKNHFQADYLNNRQLIVADITSFTDSTRLFFQGKVELSDLNNALMTLYDEIQFTYRSNQYMLHLSNEIKSIRKLVNQLISFLSNAISEDEFESTKQQERVHYYVEMKSNEANTIMSILRKISIRLIDYYNQLAIEDPKLISNGVSFIHQYIEKLTKITSMDESNNYLTIDATRINNKFYSIIINTKNVKIQNHSIEWLSRMKRVLFLSAGNYYNSKMTGNANWIDLNNTFEYVNLPKLFKSNKPTLNFPVEFSQKTKESERIHEIADFIESEVVELGDKIIVIMPNQSLVTDLFKQLVGHKQISGDFHIFAESITGSLNRIRRRIYETDKVIVILRERSFMQLLWGDNQENFSFIMYNLPFQSPSETSVKAKYHYLSQTKDDVELFNDILLPQMVQRLKNIVSFIGRHYNKEKLFILDKRLYTKYYTKEILDQLESMLEFKLLN